MRLPPIRRSEADDAQAAVFDGIVASRPGDVLSGGDVLPGPFNAMVVAPSVGGPLQSLGAAVRRHTSLPDRVRELAILVVADHEGSAVEWAAHVDVARSLGLDDEDFAAVRDGVSPPRWSPVEANVVDTTRRLLGSGDLTDREYSAAESLLGPVGVVELTTLVGYYALLALQLRVFRADRDAPAVRSGRPVPDAVLPRLGFEALPVELRDLLGPRVERLGYLGEFFACCAHQPEALAQFVGFTESLKAALPAAIVEAIALTAAATLGNDYERNQHERLCLALGLGREFVERVDAGCDGSISLDQPLATCQRFVLAALGGDDRGLAGELVVDLCARLGPSGAVAVVLTTARYAAHALVVRSFGLDPPVAPIERAPA